MYEPVVRATKTDISACALVGTTSCVIGWDISNKLRKKKLLGFALRRSTVDPVTDEVMRMQWLNGQKRFASVQDDFGFDARSDQAPFQRFRWNDYTLQPGLAYHYEVIPMVAQTVGL